MTKDMVLANPLLTMLHPCLAAKVSKQNFIFNNDIHDEVLSSHFSLCSVAHS